MTLKETLIAELQSAYPAITTSHLVDFELSNCQTRSDCILILEDHAAKFREEIPFNKIRRLSELESDGLFDGYSGMRTATDYGDGRKMIRLHAKYGILDERKTPRVLEFFESEQEAFVAHPITPDAETYHLPLFD